MAKSFEITIPKYINPIYHDELICHQACPFKVDTSGGNIQYCNMNWGEPRVVGSKNIMVVIPDPSECPGSPDRDVTLKCTPDLGASAQLIIREAAESGIRYAEDCKTKGFGTASADAFIAEFQEILKAVQS